MRMPIPSRRAFLSAALGATAAPLLTPRPAVGAPGDTATAADAAAPLKLGIASYSLRKFPLDQALAICQRLRVRYITLKDVHLPRTDSLEVVAANRRKIEAAGLTILGGGTIYWKAPDEAEIRKDFEYAKAAGMPLMVCAPAPETLDIVETLVKQYDIKVAIHNHGPEDKIYPTPYEANRLIGKRDPRVGLCIDIGHTARAGRHIAQTIWDLRERVLDVHLKDLKDVKVRGSDTECGRGVFDFPEIFRALLGVGFSGHAALEYEINENDPAAGMNESLAYMRGVAAGIGRA
jgi:sugar phosphate isomerase/epimerase